MHVYSVLCVFHRAKSFSTPTLAGANRQTQGQCPSLTSQNPAICCPQFSLHRFDRSRRGEETQGSVFVQGWAGKAADFGGDEEKDPAADRQQLDPSAEQQRLQGAHLRPPEKASVAVFVFMQHTSSPSPFNLQLAPLLLQVWVSGQPGHLSTLAHSAELPPATLGGRWVLQPQ